MVSMTYALLFSIAYIILRYLWVFKLPCHGDLGYFVDPRCIHDRRYHFKDTMVTYLLGGFRVLSCWFYQTAWILAGSYQPFKKVKNLMSSLLIILSGIALYHVAEMLGIDGRIAYIMYLLIAADFVFGGYVTTADKLVMAFIPVVLYYWLQGNYWLAFTLIAIDVFMNKPVGIFIYGPLTVYTMYLHPNVHNFVQILVPLLAGLALWNVWLWYNDNNMKLALETIEPLNRPRTYAKERHPLYHVYTRKLGILASQIRWAPVVPILAIGALLLEQQHPIVLLLLLGCTVNWVWQKGRNAYYFLPFLSVLALLAAQVPLRLVPIAVICWAIAQFFQMEDLRLCMHHLIVYFHFRKCELIEKVFSQYVEPKSSLTLVGNFTCVWHMTDTTCPDPKILGWGSNAFLSLHGREPEKWDGETWHVPAPWTDYALCAIVKNPGYFLGVWYHPIVKDPNDDITLFQHLKRSDQWDKIQESILTHGKEHGIIPPSGGAGDETDSSAGNQLD